MSRKYKDGSRPYHDREKCQGETPHPCPWHAPSKHKMRNLPRHIRFDKLGLVERICTHGVGHPDPDSVAYLTENIIAGDPTGSLSVHGCCGCCGE